VWVESESNVHLGCLRLHLESLATFQGEHWTLTQPTAVTSANSLMMASLRPVLLTRLTTDWAKWNQQPEMATSLNMDLKAAVDAFFEVCH